MNSPRFYSLPYGNPTSGFLFAWNSQGLDCRGAAARLDGCFLHVFLHGNPLTW